MRIGFDAKRAFFNNTGLGNYSRDTIRILSKFYPEHEYFLYTPKKKRNNRIDFLLEQKNIIVRTPSLFNKIVPSIWRSKRVTKDLMRDGIEIYHGLSHELPLGIEKTKIKTVITIHDLIFMRFPDLFNKIDRNIYYRKIKYSCKHASRIIAASKQTKKDIINFLDVDSKKIQVLYQGCNPIFQSDIPDRFKKNIINKYDLPANFLLFVGSIEKRKNLLTLLKSIVRLPNQNLVVIGDGNGYKQECISFIRKNNIDSQIRFLKELETEEIAAIYQLADIMIFPSLFEGFGIPILEALFSKIPVITSKIGCFSEVGGNHSKYIDPFSEQEIKSAILEIQGNQKKKEKMTEEGFKHAQYFTDEKIAKNLITTYDELYRN